VLSIAHHQGASPPASQVQGRFDETEKWKCLETKGFDEDKKRLFLLRMPCFYFKRGIE
jgi:hypothetical protein